MRSALAFSFVASIVGSVSVVVHAQHAMMDKALK
jgi:hypothetical protein